MAESARRMSTGLGADAARRLIARPIHRQTLPTARPARSTVPGANETAADAPTLTPEPATGSDLTSRLEAEIQVMKAVIAAERHENATLRSCVAIEDEPLSEEARAVRDRWSSLVDRLLQAQS